MLGSPAAFGQQVPETKENAGAWFQRGTEAYTGGNFHEAVMAFERAYGLKPHAAAAFNRAHALERLGDGPQAAEAYALALSRAELRPEDQTEARDRLLSLQQTLGALSVTGPEGARASIGHLKRTPLPIKIFLAPGRYELALVRNDGQRATMTVEARASLTTALTISNEGYPWPAPVPVGKPAYDPRLRVPAAAYVTFAGAVLAAGAGTYWGWTGLAARDDFERSGRTNAEQRDRAIERRALANVAFGVAALSAATGVVLVYRASAPELRATFGGTVGKRLGLSVSTRF